MVEKKKKIILYSWKVIASEYFSYDYGKCGYFNAKK